MEVRGFSAFRVTRYSDLDLANSDEDDDLLTQIEEQVFQRRFAEVVRVEVERGISRELRDLILAEVLQDQPPEMPTLTESDLVETGPLLDLGDLMWLATMNIPELRDPPFIPATPPELRDRRGPSSTRSASRTSSSTIRSIRSPRPSSIF